jgi:hypothetical protein
MQMQTSQPCHACCRGLSCVPGSLNGRLGPQQGRGDLGLRTCRRSQGVRSHPSDGALRLRRFRSACSCIALACTGPALAACVAARATCSWSWVLTMYVHCHVFVAYWYLRVTRLELVLFFFLVGITTRRRKNSTGDRDGIDRPGLAWLAAPQAAGTQRRCWSNLPGRPGPRVRARPPSAHVPVSCPDPVGCFLARAWQLAGQGTKQASTIRPLPNTHEAAQSGTRGTGTCQPAAEAAADPAPAGIPQAKARGGKVGAAAAYGPGLGYRPVLSNRRDPVSVYQTGLARNRSKSVEVKFEFKILCANCSYRYTGRLDRFTGRFGRFTVDLMIFSDG